MPPGRYPTAAGDVLAVDVVEGERARAPRRPREAAPPASRPVAVVLATHVRVGEDGPARAAETRRQPELGAALIDAAVAVLNAGVRAARAATGDPYLADVTAADARAVRIGTASADDVAAGRWSDAFEPGAGRPPRERRADAVRVTQEVAEALAGRLTPFEAEELALRALADLAHGRPRAGAHQARAAHDLIREELGAPGDAAALPADAEAAELLARHVLETAAAHRAERLRELRR